MDEMSLYVILFVSIPESMLNIIIGCLITGQKHLIFPTSKNKAARFLLSISLMTLASFAIRYLAPIGLISLAFHFIIYVLIIKLIYRLKWSESIPLVVMFTLILMIIEVVYYPPVLDALKKNLSSLYSDDVLRILFTMPIRIIQLFIAVSLWNYRTVLVDLKKYAGIHRITNSFLIILLLIEVSVTFTFIRQINTMELYLKVINGLICIGFAAFNILVFRFITKLTKAIIVTETEKHAGQLNELDKVINKLFAVLGGNKE